MQRPVSRFWRDFLRVKSHAACTTALALPRQCRPPIAAPSATLALPRHHCRVTLPPFAPLLVTLHVLRQAGFSRWARTTEPRLQTLIILSTGAIGLGCSSKPTRASTRRRELRVRTQSFTMSVLGRTIGGPKRPKLLPVEVETYNSAPRVRLGAMKRGRFGAMMLAVNHSLAPASATHLSSSY